MRSIMQSVKECYLCRKDADLLGYIGDLTSSGLDRHHVIFGTAGRKQSEKLGLWVYLCKKHHNEDHGAFAVHYNKTIREELCKDAERAYLREHTFEDWMSVFGKNWLDLDEINRIKTKDESSLTDKKAIKTKETELCEPINRKMTKPPDGFIFLEGTENE